MIKLERVKPRNHEMMQNDTYRSCRFRSRRFFCWRGRFGCSGFFGWYRCRGLRGRSARIGSCVCVGLGVSTTIVDSLRWYRGGSADHQEPQVQEHHVREANLHFPFSSTLRHSPPYVCGSPRPFPAFPGEDLFSCFVSPSIAPLESVLLQALLSIQTGLAVASFGTGCMNSCVELGNARWCGEAGRCWRSME